MDSQKNKENQDKNKRENAKTVKNASCGEEELDGAPHQTVEADFNTLQGSKTDNHYKYWGEQGNRTHFKSHLPYQGWCI